MHLPFYSLFFIAFLFVLLLFLLDDLHRPLLFLLLLLATNLSTT